jgi:hypothetical protein
VTSQPSLLMNPIDVAFWEFHHANPHVYAGLVDLARQWRRAGHDACSMNMLFEKLRWDVGVSTSGDHAGFKLNNNYRSRYSRLVSANEADLAGMFATRELADEHDFDAARRWVQTRTEVAA